MDIFGPIIILFVIAIPVLSIVALVLASISASKVKRQEERLRFIEQQFLLLSSQIADIRAGKMVERPVAAAPPTMAQPMAPTAPPASVLPAAVPPAVVAPEMAVPGISRPLVSPPPYIEKTTPTFHYPSVPTEVPPPIDLPVTETPMPSPRTGSEWEMLIGGNVFNRIGAILLIIAAALFITLDLKNDVFTPTPMLRLVVGLLSGVVLLWVGSNSHKKQLIIFGQGLIGAGIGIFYLTFYGAYGFFHLINLPVTLIGMFLVTLVALWQSTKYDSIVIALLGWFGGVCTPFLLNSPESGMAVFIYLIFFQVGLLAFQVLKPAWTITLEPLTLISVYVIYFYGYYTHGGGHSLQLIPFLAVYWALLLAFDVYRNRQAGKSVDTERWVYFSLNAASCGIALYLLLSDFRSTLIPLGLLGIALTHGLLAFGLLAGRLQVSQAEKRNLLAAIVFLALAIYKQYHGLSLVNMWTLEAVLLVFAGLYWKRSYIWAAALLLFSVDILALLLSDGALAFAPILKFTPVFNPRCLAFLLLASALFACTQFFTFMDKKRNPGLISALHYAWSIIIAILITVEVNDAFNKLYASGGTDKLFWAARYMMLAVSWTLYSLPLVWFGLRQHNRALYVIGLIKLLLGALTLAIFGLQYSPLSSFLPIINTRAIPFLLVIIGLGLQARWLRQQAEGHPWVLRFIEIVKGVLILLLFELLTVETLDLFHKGQLGNSHIWYHFTLMMVLPIIWTLYAAGAQLYAWRRPSPAITTIAMCAQSLAVLWIAFAGVHYQPISNFHPIVNLRSVTFLIIIAGMALQYRLLAKQQVSKIAGIALTSLFPLITAWLCLELLTVETIDIFHRWDMMTKHVLHQIALFRLMMLAGVWAVYSLPVIWLAFRRVQRGLLLTGWGALVLAVACVVGYGSEYVPITAFTPIINYRTLLFALVIIVCVLHIMLLRRRGTCFPELDKLPGIMRVGISLLALQLCTVEVVNYFHKASLAAMPNPHLDEIRQMVLCVVWVLYSLLVLAYGIWKKYTPLRLVAIGIFIATLIITCGYFLFINNLFYRIIAIVALALSLLGTSYLYQRYKGVIMAPRGKEE